MSTEKTGEAKSTIQSIRIIRRNRESDEFDQKRKQLKNKKQKKKQAIWIRLNHKLDRNIIYYVADLSEPLTFYA